MFSCSNFRVGFSGPKSVYRFDVFSLIFSIGIREIQHLSIILIQVKSVTFMISPRNVEVLRVEVICATRNRRDRLTDPFCICLANFTRLVMETKIVLHRNDLQHCDISILE
jgi:hypothetical protein